MIRQAHTYLVGALSGVTLIGIAIGVFILLVSAQVFHEWPIADLGGHNENSAVSSGQALPTTGGVAATVGTGASAGRPNAAKAAAGAVPTTPKHAVHRKALADPGAVADATTPESAGSIPSPSDGEPSPGGHSGSNSSQPSSSSQSSSPSNSSGSSGLSGNGGAATASSGSSGSGSGTAAGTTVPPVTTKPPQVAATVNETVHAVDEGALGGTLEKTGVTEVTEGVANGVAGPETVVGKTVQGVGEVVGGLLGGSGH
jgi:hypothetical protein